MKTIPTLEILKNHFYHGIIGLSNGPSCLSCYEEPVC